MRCSCRVSLIHSGKFDWRPPNRYSDISGVLWCSAAALVRCSAEAPVSSGMKRSVSQQLVNLYRPRPLPAEHPVEKMELERSIIDNLLMAELRKICKERGQTLEKWATKVDFQRACEEVHRVQDATREWEGNDPEEEEENVEKEQDNEEGDGVVTSPDL
ncbi:hypothetical protein NDU88_002852 [Pleurodeles waltl]|uniref:Uncharacterized protein n=1 Tax=Pleurodeles waltl TaxID=8319 RepID=A0AAV7UWS8_PLEWA|nr:hypothetical protein NDU88_002852 [Pleurodeles waltl]